MCFTVPGTDGFLSINLYLVGIKSPGPVVMTLGCKQSVSDIGIVNTTIDLQSVTQLIVSQYVSQSGGLQASLSVIFTIHRTLILGNPHRSNSFQDIQLQPGSLSDQHHADHVNNADSNLSYISMLARIQEIALCCLAKPHRIETTVT